jgi:CRP-like cAMP-binding protein/di/tricarboxylate transporter
MGRRRPLQVRIRPASYDEAVTRSPRPDDDPAQVLSRVPLCAGLDRVTLAKLAAHFERVRFGGGEVVFREGDPGDAFYVVLHGTFSDYVGSADAGVDRRLATRGPGASFGDIALLSNRPRSTTVRADTAGEVLRLDRSRFLGLVAQEPAVALAIAATLSERVWLANVRGVGTVEARETEQDPGLDPRAPIAVAAEPRAGSPGRRALGGGLAILILALTWVLPPPAGLTPAGWRALGTLGAMVPVLGLEVLPEGVLALVAISVWTLGGIAPARVGLAGFATPSWILVVAVLVFGAALAATGLLYRLALLVVERARGGYAGQAAALAVAGIALGPAVPNATGRVAFLAPALGELIEALGYAPGSRPAAGLALAALLGFGQMGAVFLTSSTTAVLAHAVLPAPVRASAGWIGWAVCAAPANALLLVGMLVALVWLYGPRPGASAPAGPRPGVLAMQRALLGRPSRAERACLLAGAGLVLGCATQPLHGIDPAWLAVLALGALGIGGLVTAETLRGVNWSFALFFGMLASLADVLAATGVDRWLAGVVGGMTGNLAAAPVALVAGLAVLGILASLVLRWQAAAPILTIAAAPVADAAGLSPLVVAVVATIACNGFLVPYQSTTYLALYHGTGGRLFDHRLARPAAFAYAAASLLALCASVPAWRWLGFL